MMVRLISQTFRSIKPPNNNNLKPPKSEPSSTSSSPLSDRSRSKLSWSVYLILSTNKPIKTYVGVTTNFSRRKRHSLGLDRLLCQSIVIVFESGLSSFSSLKQHNGEIKGGAKASRSGRPWVCACLIQGFADKSKACEFESKWKSCSRKMPRKRKTTEMEEQVDGDSFPLLQHRHAALDRVKGLIDCSHLEIVWQLDPS